MLVPLFNVLSYFRPNESDSQTIKGLVLSHVSTDRACMIVGKSCYNKLLGTTSRSIYLLSKADCTNLLQHIEMEIPIGNRRVGRGLCHNIRYNQQRFLGT